MIGGALAVAALASGGVGVRAASDRVVSGTVVSQVVTTGCASPIGVCTTGEFRGGIQGRFEFTGTSLTPSADTPTTGVVSYTGDLTIHTRDGDLLVKDAGALDTTPGTGDIASVSVVVGGTGGMAGATGRIRINGIFQAGCVDCAYTGKLRLP